MKTKRRLISIAGAAGALALALTLTHGLAGPLPIAAAVETPVAVDDSYTVGQDAELLVETPGVLANDSFTEGLSANFVTYTAPHGKLTFSGTASIRGAFRYVPDIGFTGTDTFLYCVGHGTGTGECLSNVATLSITVEPVEAIDDYYSATPGSPLVVDRPGVSVNDVNVNLIQHRWKVGRLPGHGAFVEGGSVRGSSFAFSYQADPGFAGTDSFEYCIADETASSCISASATVYIEVGTPVVSRLDGADRFEVAARVAQQTHPMTAASVYVATGTNYPDALSAAPAAVRQGAPLLLATRDEVPSATATEISRLSPAKIVIVGGPNSISDAVVTRLQALAPTATVSRISGADRYEVSRAVAADAFGAALHGFITTGANFPDALSAGGAAGSAAEPVILVNGLAPAADPATSATLSALGTTSLTIVGGTNSVSAGVENSLKSSATVTRAAGADRFEASYNVNHTSFVTAATVYLATGLNYPDALVGGVIAGRNHAPLYAVHTDCVPSDVLHEIVRLGARNVVLIGGTNSLTEAVRSLTPCP